MKICLLTQVVLYEEYHFMKLLYKNKLYIFLFHYSKKYSIIP